MKVRCKHRNNRWCGKDDSPCYDFINAIEGENCEEYEEEESVAEKGGRVMLASLHCRQSGKYSVWMNSLDVWCSRAKIGNKILLSSPYGDFVLEFKGEFKPKKAKMKFCCMEEGGEHD